MFLVLPFCVHWTIFVAGAACWLGQTSNTPSLRGPVVGVCMHACAHSGLRAHVTLFHAKRSEECYNPDSARPSEMSAPGLFQHTSRWHCGNGTVPLARLCLPPCVALCNSGSARMPCAPQPLPSHPATTVSSAAALPLLASSAAAARLSKPKTPTLGDILKDWGLSKH